nr:immunoglobulin light chain junction region [Mus musculus]NSL99327.1 immunoglobulin light chain junction region [Mus musculus]
CFQGSHVPRTF